MSLAKRTETQNCTAGIHSPFTAVKVWLTATFTRRDDNECSHATRSEGDRPVTSQGQRDSRDRDRVEDIVHDSTDLSPEMSKLLEGRRWEVQEGPFRGFGSPPGRF